MGAADRRAWSSCSARSRALGIPRADKVGPEETQDERDALHAPSIVAAGTAMGLLRGAVGFFTFFAAFALKWSHEPAWMFGVVIIGERGRRRDRHDPRAVAAQEAARGMDPRRARCSCPRCRSCIAARVSTDAARWCSPPSRSRRGAACGRVAFDSLLQRDGAEAARGRAFARFETRFQLVWVAGGVLAVVFPGGGEAASSSSPSCCCSRASRTSAGSGDRRREKRRRRPPRPALERGVPIEIRADRPDELGELLLADQRGFGRRARPTTRRAAGRGGARSHPRRVRRRHDRRDLARVLVRADDARRRALAGRGGVVGGGASDASRQRRAHADDRGVARRRTRARRARGDAHRVRERRSTGASATASRHGGSRSRRNGPASRFVPSPRHGHLPLRDARRDRRSAPYRSTKRADVARRAWCRGPTSGGSRSFWDQMGGGHQKAFFVVVHSDADGNDDGYVAYEIVPVWSDGLAQHAAVVRDFQAGPTSAGRALAILLRRRPRADGAGGEPADRRSPAPSRHRRRRVRTTCERRPVARAARSGGAARCSLLRRAGSRRARSSRARRLGQHGSRWTPKPSPRRRRQPMHRLISCAIARCSVCPRSAAIAGASLPARVAFDVRRPDALQVADQLFERGPHPCN